MRTSRISIVFLLALATSALAAMVGGTSAAHAQPTRVAYIDAGKILDLMPEATDAKARLEQLTRAWTKQATDMQNEIDRKQAEFDRRKLIMTDAERNADELDLSNLRKQHEEFLHKKFDANGGELFQQEAQQMQPAYKRLSQAIKEVALDDGYDYVIDRSSKDVVLLYTNSKFDITQEVAQKLGIQTGILSTPLVSGKPGAPLVPPRPPTQPGVQKPAIPPNPAIGKGLVQPQQPPNYNSGGYNPNQFPPAQKPQPTVTH